MVVTATGGGVSQFLEAELDRNATMVQVRVRLATPVSALWRHIGIPLATCHSLDSSRRVILLLSEKGCGATTGTASGETELNKLKAHLLHDVTRALEKKQCTAALDSYYKAVEQLKWSVVLTD